MKNGIKISITLILAFFLYAPSFAASSFEKIKQIAELGDTVAQLKLANSYYVGESIPQNYVEAAKWYLVAAKKEMLSRKIT